MVQMKSRESNLPCHVLTGGAQGGGHGPGLPIGHTHLHAAARMGGLTKAFERIQFNTRNQQQQYSARIKPHVEMRIQFQVLWLQDSVKPKVVC